MAENPSQGAPWRHPWGPVPLEGGGANDDVGTWGRSQDQDASCSLIVVASRMFRWFIYVYLCIIKLNYIYIYMCVCVHICIYCFKMF